MRTILLIISYDGTHFCGWQSQQGVRTVQEEIEKALQVVHKLPVAIHGSGRTDSGVHAAGQAASFNSPIDSIPVENYVPALNSCLPYDIRILEARKMPLGFHARFHAVNRTYRYFIHCAKAPLAHQLPYMWSIRRYPNITRLNRMASWLQGEIDCSTFSATGDQSISRMRYLEKAVFFMDGDMLVFEICANAFLWKMVRSLVGTLLYFEQHRSENDFKAALEAKDRRYAGPTAPPQGLFLWNVGFDGIRRGPQSAKQDQVIT